MPIKCPDTPPLTTAQHHTPHPTRGHRSGDPEKLERCAHEHGARARVPGRPCKTCTAYTVVKAFVNACGMVGKRCHFFATDLNQFVPCTKKGTACAMFLIFVLCFFFTKNMLRVLFVSCSCKASSKLTLYFFQQVDFFVFSFFVRGGRPRRRKEVLHLSRLDLEPTSSVRQRYCSRLNW